MTAGTRNRVLAAVAIVLAMAGAYWYLRQSGAMAIIADSDALRRFIAGLGVAGPFMVVGLMTLAILVSLIPSAPIALAAGAAYGHTWGAAYIVVGAELGALATLAGILPASFLLAHFGGEMATGELDRILFAVLALGLVTGVPLAVHLLRERRRRRAASLLDR